MTRTILIASTEESIGKTAVCVALGLLAKERGLSVGYMKPKGTRLQSRVGKTLDEDPMLARELLDLDAKTHEMEPIVYSPTFIEQAIRGKEDTQDLREVIESNFENLSEDRDLMIIEGAGELTIGGIVDLTDADLAELLDAEVILVSGFDKAADVDRILAAADFLGDRLEGIIFNSITNNDYDFVETAVTSFLGTRDIPVLGVLPRERELAGITVDDLADELNAESLTNAPMDAFIERFHVGAMSGETALPYLRRTKDAAVITGGDRADIHTAALEAPGVKCLILTGGLRPSGAVVGKAEERGVPILLVQSETLTTIDEVEEIVRSGRTRDEKTVERMRQLLYEHADIDAILNGQSE